MLNQSITRCGLICSAAEFWLSENNLKKKKKVGGAAGLREPEHVKRHLIGIYASKVEFGGGGGTWSPRAFKSC